MRERFTDHPERYISAASMKREIPDDFKYNPKKAKHLKKVLHNVTISLGTLTSSLIELSKLKGPDISPDGLLGGRGYIIPFKEVKENINNAARSLSDIADTIADELTNPRWDVKDDKDVKKLIKEKDEAVEKVEEVEEEIGPDDLTTVEDLKEDAEDEEEEKPEAEEDEEPLPDPDPDNKDKVESRELRNASFKGEDQLRTAVCESLVNFFNT